MSGLGDVATQRARAVKSRAKEKIYARAIANHIGAPVSEIQQYLPGPDVGVMYSEISKRPPMQSVENERDTLANIVERRLRVPKNSIRQYLEPSPREYLGERLERRRRLVMEQALHSSREMTGQAPIDAVQARLETNVANVAAHHTAHGRLQRHVYHGLGADEFNVDDLKALQITRPRPKRSKSRPRPSSSESLSKGMSSMGFGLR